ncbi:6-phosphogluconate dehydrogenase, decarboxylating [Rhizophagus irregularis DAOM 181602=DAOM 197198]|uniref:phosphogluconate dehydrogenase (NADP(+)-dependent, decarboxylating) n=1 Tax=Rhizophagus irregularis (strain DAOM 181602 / DAOM 197198 / MUCL 43194) TaxID=747089 RepID=A0A2P4PJU0_RHIID|nr:hypothetical protein GLOIN_2v1781506 [Rhizophagus irregularis DAOM 181602=DAOM 197198]POG65651.1 hypothetical protein GLOIN_2v1781506 [Rhizophagus irregularis DAOM 181602=DAOM 197198]GET54928.1 6-phosphogluconate dehydrogenase, decarboxylating [Rhizophagus irregularis DAOM 181602=DAOM 197198]|eukprot:XP_025172517.1 hypothetical protein GLOIN_2v1781506 [Rhizophagus irregularis DAOM 181602=DAOM 197198]
MLKKLYYLDSEESYMLYKWIGETGAEHYVKIVYNSIEYSDMQLICEAYHLMKEGLYFD